MSSRLKGWMVVLLLGGVAAYAIAEDITLTTYYPSPRGVYQELRTTSNAFFATDGGNVGIGTRSSGSYAARQARLDGPGDAAANATG